MISDVKDSRSSREQVKETDCLDRFIFAEKDIRACFVKLKDTLLENHQNQNYPDYVKQLLNEFMLGSVLLSSNLKFEGRLVLQLRSDSAISLIMAECNDEGQLRAYAQFEDLPNDFSFSDLKGGTLAITVDPKEGEPYQGIVPLNGDDLAQCLRFYFQQSEQLNSHFYLFNNGEQAIGFMLQQLPAQLQKDQHTRDIDWQDLQTLANTLTQDEACSLSGEMIMYRLYHDYVLRFLGQTPLRFVCRCSKKKMDQALLSLGREEIEAIILEQGNIDMSCELCGSAYLYDLREALAIFDTDISHQTMH